MDPAEQDRRYLKSLCILYVEDDDDVREQFAEFLRFRCGSLVTAENGASGLEAFRAHRPQIVVTDILMPVLDGLSMAEQIQGIDPAVPIIVTTAFENISYLRKAIDIGVDKYVTKPVEAPRMTQALLACAHRLRVEHQLIEELKFRRDSELALMEKDLLQRAKLLRERVEAEERSRVSRDIHDSIGQSLVALKLNLEMLQALCQGRKCPIASRLGEFVAEIDGVSAELRDILLALRPAFLETTSLVEALRWLCDRASRPGLTIDLSTSGVAASLPPPLKLAFFRICQEALNNVLKHAHARRVQVSLVLKDEILRLTVADDGLGGLPPRALGKRQGKNFGISIMRERSALVNGTLSIDSPPGEGTTITVEAPLL